MKVYSMINNKTANLVLKEFKKLARISDLDLTVALYSYTNGREQGYALDAGVNLTRRKVAFSENRNSDDIVVYFGTALDFEQNTNIPSDKVYASRKFFDYNKADRAAEFIFDYLAG
jgi:hypothetical protein